MGGVEGRGAKNRISERGIGERRRVWRLKRGDWRGETHERRPESEE